MADSESTSQGSRSGTDVFISYSTKNKGRALDVARSFEALGWKVWIDRWRLVVGARFHQKIDKALAESKAVVVLWSEASVASDWVLAEADHARQHDLLIPARLDATSVPKPFGIYHTADLGDWDGADPQHSGFVALKEAVAEKLQTSVPDQSHTPRPRWSQAARLFAPFLAASALIATILTLLVFRFRLPLQITYGVPITVTVLMFLLQGNQLIGALREWVEEMACGTAGLVVLSVAVLGFASFPRVSILRASHVPLAASLQNAAGTKVLRQAELTSEARSVHWWVPVPPWGREVRVALAGYDFYPTKIYPWRSVEAIPGEELVPHPVVLIRLHHTLFGLRRGAQLHLEQNNEFIASGSLDADSASLLIGGSHDLKPLEAGWRRKLQNAGEPEPDIVQELAEWGKPTACEWSGRPPALDAEVVVVLTTSGGVRLRSKPIRLDGAYTDVEQELFP